MSKKESFSYNYVQTKGNLQILGFLLVLVLLSIFTVLGVILVRLESDRFQERQVEQVQRNLEELRLNLRSRIYANLYKVSSINALIALNPDLTQEDFSRAMEIQFRGEPDLRNIGLAREMILEFMHPIEGNEAAIGLDYRTIPEQFAAVELALRLNTIVMAGPLNLVQGGKGLIARVPLYITNQGTQTMEFWGFASVVMNSDSILLGAGISEDHPTLQLALRGRDAQGPEGEVFWGNERIFDRSPVELLIDLPYGSWQIGAIPKNGWSDYLPFSNSFIWIYLTVVTIMLGFFLIIFHLVGKQKKASDALELERNLFAAGPVFTMEWDPRSKDHWTVKNFSSNAPEILGYSPEEMLRPEFSYNEIIHPDDLDSIVQDLKTNIQNHLDQFDQSYRVKKKDGKFVWLYDFTQLVRDISGNLISIRSYMYDQTIQIQTKEALKLAQERLERTAYELTENIPVGTYTMILPPEGGMAKLGFMSRRFLEITGLTRELAAADPMNAFRSIHPEDFDQWVDLNVKTFQEKSNFYGETRIIVDGEIHWVQAESTPRILPDGSTVWEGVIADITERKQAEEELRNAIELAEQASRAKSEFLANMSHEIRTPLNGIIGFTDVLSQTPLTNTQKHYVEYAHVAGQSLLGVINDILDFSKIEAGMMDLEPVQTTMVEFFEQSIDVISYSATAKQLEVLLDLDPRLPKFAMIDPVRLRQVLINLLGNAIKFTSHGEIELSVRYSPLEEGKGTLNLRVRDTGIGIGPDQKEKLFKAFSQADSSTTRKFGGTGLGLIISKKLVEQMGGHLDFTSELGKGTTFQFSISPETHGITTPQLRYIKSIRHCLIIDDNQSSGRNVKQLLDLWNIESQCYSSGHDGLMALQTNHDYDLVILDYSMPDMNGLDVLASLRTTLGLGPEVLPVVMTHTLSHEAMLDQNLEELAIHQWLIKPIKQHQLFECLSLLATDKKLTGINGEPSESIHNRDSQSPTVSQSETFVAFKEKKDITILIAEDIPMNLILIKTLIKSLVPGVTMVEAVDGNQAVNQFSLHKPDLILMDVQMPEVDGLEATRTIRNLETKYQTKTPIIALTAGALKEEMEKCYAAGMDDFLTKPLDREVLYEKIHKFL